MTFPNAALFGAMTAIENAAFGLRASGWRAREATARALEALDATNELDDPLSLPFLREQLPPGEDLKWTGDTTLEDVLSEHVFASEEPPRWVLLFHAGQLVLIDRTKWADRRLLRFHFDRIFTGNDASRLLPALAGAESICPHDGNNLLDRLDEGSHKHAAKVSEDLKYSARDCIERIGNEALYYLGDVLKERVHGVLAPEDLSRECLRYLYRLLFLFYVEARPALGYAPMDSDEYRTGYSLETLRELALMPLDTERSRNGEGIGRACKQGRTRATPEGAPCRRGHAGLVGFFDGVAGSARAACFPDGQHLALSQL